MLDSNLQINTLSKPQLNSDFPELWSESIRINTLRNGILNGRLEQVSLSGENLIYLPEHGEEVETVEFSEILFVMFTRNLHIDYDLPLLGLPDLADRGSTQQFFELDLKNGARLKGELLCGNFSKAVLQIFVQISLTECRHLFVPRNNVRTFFLSPLLGEDHTE